MRGVRIIQRVGGSAREGRGGGKEEEERRTLRPRREDDRAIVNCIGRHLVLRGSSCKLDFAVLS